MNKTAIVIACVAIVCLLAGFIVYATVPRKEGLDRLPFMNYDSDANSLKGGLKLKND